MTVVYHPADQGSVDWHQARLGVLTASDFAKAMGSGVTREKLLHRLNFERRTGRSARAEFTTPAMQHGIDNEPYARSIAAFDLGVDIREVGLATNSELPGLGASLDGLVGNIQVADMVGIEIKCPNPDTHDMYLARKRLPPAYKWQVYGQMLVCELQAVWFMSYHPDDSEHLLIRIDRDEKVIEELHSKLNVFLSDLKALR